ncbi:GGDEF domain-containing protein [Shewanella mangrovisoli]|uniref:GGDEF domain-containing protein n=1 Tax=Shewanella mangrovisoli TaxID=2864211 RepID=UPI0035BAE465
MIKLILKSLAISITLYASVVFCLHDSVSKRITENFTLTMKLIKDRQKLVIFTAFSINNELSNKGNSTSVNNDKIKNKIDLLNDTLNIENNHDLLNYKSYIDDKSTDNIDTIRTTVTSSFNPQQCREYKTCTKYSSLYSLSDNVEVSYIYKKPMDSNRYITISSPIYYKNKLIGDVNSTLVLDNIDAFEGYTLNRTTKNLMAVSILKNYDLTTKPLKTVKYQLDNTNMFVLEITLIDIILYHIWLWLIIFPLTLYILVKFKLHHENKIKLVISEERRQIDELTGLFNRAVFNNKNLKYNINRFGACVLSIDGNKIKLINDTYGHDVGDQAICVIANSMKQIFRESDYLIRTGGDEFIAILPNCKVNHGKTLATKLAELIESNYFSDYNLSISASIGLSYCRKYNELNLALKKADINLYKNKKHYS